MAGQHDTSTTTPVPFCVKGKSALVTGAGSGINLSFTKLLLAKGCNVVLADLTLRPEAEALLSQYPSSPSPSSSSPSSSPRALFHKTDVTSWTSLSTTLSFAISTFHTIDLFVPGAGIYDPPASNFWLPPTSSSPPLSSRDAAHADRYASIDVNLTHPLRLTQLAIAHFLNPGAPGVPRVSPANPKRVLLVSSIAGQRANLNTPLYVAAKHGVNGFIRALGPLEQRTGIRVNGVAPGVVKTPLWTEHPEKLKFVDAGVGGRDEWASSDEVAEAMLRCVEEDDLVGGTILEVGKGQTRRVEAVNDPGPSGRGHTVSRLEEGYDEVFGWLEEEGWGLKGSKL
ncbi:hypothetical protein ACN47E_004519 [Coniothyrium glycines]